MIKGHHLKLQSLLKNAGHRYCDHCTGTVWLVIKFTEPDLIHDD